MAKKLLLISIDGLSAADLPKLQMLAPFGRMFSDGACVMLQTVSPAEVCPVHTSLVTGVYPDRHGVVSDAPCSVGVKTPLPHSLRAANKAKTLFSAAKAAELTTAAVCWPVTAGDAEIDHLATENAADDTAAVSAATELLQEYRPNLTLLRLRGILDARRAYGIDSPEANAAIKQSGEVIGALAALAENVVLVSCVSPQTVSRAINLNAEFVKHGLISLDESGNYFDYKAWCQSNGMSSFVYLKNPSNMGVHDQTEELLTEMQKSGDFGIGKVISREDAAEQNRLYGSFSFVVCSDGNTVFGNDWTASAEAPAEKAACGAVTADDADGWMLAFGPSFVPVSRAEVRRLTDVPVTCAKLLGISLPTAEGRAIDEITAD